jgi:ribosomal protein L7Ae-like RNA K-turn-binding protein
MREKALNMLGLMRRANAIQIGEDKTGAAVKAGKAKLLLLAADASDNARRRAEAFITGRNVQLVPLPFDKAELSERLGVNGCSMAAVTDLGFANAFVKLLLGLDSDSYCEIAQQVEKRFEKAERRKNCKKV